MYLHICTQAETTDRSSQADAKYREALEDAQRMTKEHGVTSAQARAAWDVVDEIGVSFPVKKTAPPGWVRIVQVVKINNMKPFSSRLVNQNCRLIFKDCLSGRY